MSRIDGGAARSACRRSDDLIQFHALAAVAFASVLSVCDGPLQFDYLKPQGSIASTQRTHFLEVLALLAVFVALPTIPADPRLAFGSDGG